MACKQAFSKRGFCAMLKISTPDYLVCGVLAFNALEIEAHG